MANPDALPGCRPSMRVLGPSAPAPADEDASRAGGCFTDAVRLPAEYLRAVELARRRQDKPLLASALAELGDVYAHFGCLQEAGGAWGDALDTLLGPYQVLGCWRAELTGLTGAQLLARYGAHGLLAAGCLLGKLARYCHARSASMQLECARLGALLLPALFACSLEHPQRRLDFAGYTPLQLWPGRDLLSDPYR